MSKLSDETVILALKDIESGCRVSYVSKKYGMSYTSLRNWAKRAGIIENSSVNNWEYILQNINNGKKNKTVDNQIKVLKIKSLGNPNLLKITKRFLTYSKKNGNPDLILMSEKDFEYYKEILSGVQLYGIPVKLFK